MKSMIWIACGVYIGLAVAFYVVSTRTAIEIEEAVATNHVPLLMVVEGGAVESVDRKAA